MNPINTNRIIHKEKIFKRNQAIVSFNVIKFDNSRLLNLCRQSAYSDFIDFNSYTHNFAVDHKPILIFFEYLGESKQLPLDLFNSLKSLYTNNEIFLVIDDSYEGLLTVDDLDYLSKNINVTDFVIVSSNYKLQKKSNTVILNYHLYDRDFDNIDPQTVFVDENPILKSKKFLCLNRQERAHRILTIDYLIEKNLLKHSHASCRNEEITYLFTGKDFIKEKYGGISNYKANLEDYYKISKYASLKELKNFTFTEKQQQRLLDNTPIILEAEKNIEHDQRAMPNAQKIYEDSYWCILTERDFFSQEYEGFTEKLVKCLLYKTPFIVVGLPHTLHHLHEIGFITFSSVINEDYDKEENPEKRLSMIKTQIDYLADLDYNEHRALRLKIQRILDYNYKKIKEINDSLASPEFLNLLLKWGDSCRV